MIGANYLVAFGLLLLSCFCHCSQCKTDKHAIPHRPSTGTQSSLRVHNGPYRQLSPKINPSQYLGSNTRPGSRPYPNPTHPIPKPASASSKNSNGIVTCYYGMWSVGRPGIGQFGVGDIPPHLCTHIVYSFIGPLANGSVVFLDSELTSGGKTNKLKELVNLKKQNPDLKIQVACGGWTAASTNFTILVNNKTLMYTWIEELHKFVVEYELDGVDIDWEYPAQRGGVESDKQAFVEFIKKLKEKFGNLLVTAAVAVTQSNIDMSYNVTEMDKHLDHINLMTYDLHGPWDGVTGSGAPLYDQLTDAAGADNLSVNNSVHTWIRNGATPSKLVLGLPNYGKSYTLTSLNDTDTGAPITGAGAAGPYTQEAGTYAYYEICTDQQANATQWNITELTGNYVYANKDLFWVGYDNPDTMYVKGQYAKSLGLAGVMFWAIDLDDFSGVCGDHYPLITAAKHGFGIA